MSGETEVVVVITQLSESVVLVVHQHRKATET